MSFQDLYKTYHVHSLAVSIVFVASVLGTLSVSSVAFVEQKVWSGVYAACRTLLVGICNLLVVNFVFDFGPVCLWDSVVSFPQWS